MSRRDDWKYNVPKVNEALREFGAFQTFTNESITFQRVGNDRTSEYLWREDASKDGLVKSIISSHLTNAIGISDNTRPNITIVLKKDFVDNNPIEVVEFLEREAEKVYEKIKSIVKPLSKDALAFGDGYLSVRCDDKGIKTAIYNLGTKPYNVIPIKSNHDTEDVCYSIATTKAIIPSIGYATSNQDVFVLRLRLDDGSLEMQNVSQKYMRDYDPFSPKETYYQDTINGGLLEGQHEAYIKYKATIESSFSKKVASSIIERFVTLSMNTVSSDERDMIRTSTENALKKVNNLRKEKITNKDPSGNVVTHLLYTTGDSATSGMDISDSTVEFKDDMEDVLFHTKRLVGGLKYHIDLTTFSDSQIGERSEDSIARNSEQLEEVGGEIRMAITRLFLDALNIHFLSLTGKKVDCFEINFNAVVSRAKKEQEYDRIETLNNQQQFNDILMNMRDLGIEDTPKGREYLYSIIADLAPLNLKDKKDFIEESVNIILTKEEEVKE